MAHLDNYNKNIRSWKHLENQIFDFREVEEDNLGMIYFLNKFIIEMPDGKAIEIENTCDNGVEIIEIKFGKIENCYIQTTLKLKIDFESFHIKPLELNNTWKCHIFEVSEILKIGKTRFLNADFSLKSKEELIKITQNYLDIDDYVLVKEPNIDIYVLYPHLRGSSFSHGFVSEL